VNALSLRLSPHGRFHLAGGDPEADTLAPDAASRVRKAFAKGEGSGLLHLGAVEVESHLPPSLAFGRDLTRVFMTRLCASPDLEEKRGEVKVVPPLPEFDRLVLACPPMSGAEYLTREVLLSAWTELVGAYRQEISAWRGSVQAWLESKSQVWSSVGRVFFHLAENKGNPAAPFAFLATYSTRVSGQGRVQHLPLGRALREYAGAAQQDALLALLRPVQRASERSRYLKELVESGELFHPLAWEPAEAYRFLKEVPLLEESGVVVRVPDWWNPRKPPRPEVRVTMGDRKASSLGAGALLDFSVSLTLGNERLSAAEIREILRGTDGLVLIKGRWVEIDRERLREVMEHWREVERAAGKDGVSFLEGMRLLAGASIGGGGVEKAPVDVAEWSKVIAGEWLKGVMDALRGPESLAAVDPGGALKTDLRPYQRTGVRWLLTLSSLGLGGCLADDMGLGKTIQVLALLLLLKERGEKGPHLLVVPASLIANWRSEIERFAPSLKTLVAHPSVTPAGDLAALSPTRLVREDLVITSYGSVHRFPWMSEVAWALVVLDEAQAIKNPGARQTRSAKALKSRVRLALTGTPVENRLSDLWSLFDFLAPGLLGSAAAFSRFAKRIAEDGSPGYGPLRELVRPYILRRLKSDKSIIADLPDKTEVLSFCPLTKAQAALYTQAVEELRAALDESSVGIARRGVILSFLLRFKQICNHPSQWLGDGGFAPEKSGKFGRLRALCEEIASRQEKVLVFTQFRQMTEPLAGFLAEVFGRKGLVLSGETAVGKRKGLVDGFQDEEGPPFFVLSLKAGGTGLNLTAASHVVHFDRWWNPAVENQATDRAYRIGQRKNVLVHKFVCKGTVEERIDALIESKKAMAKGLLEGGAEALLTEMSDAELMRVVSLDIASALEEA